MAVRDKSKKRLFWILALSGIAIIPVRAFLLGQDKPRESVTVTAVEIPVRVFDGKGFVSGLTKDDFEVYENGVRQDITGFEAVSRSILPDSIALPGPIPNAPRKRNFILIFNVYAYTDQIGEAIDFFFKNVFGPGDRFVTLVNEGLVQIKGEGSGEDIAARHKNLLLSVKKNSLADLESAFRYMDERAVSLGRALNGDDSTDYPTDPDDPLLPVKMFLTDYQRAWKEYEKGKRAVNLDLYKSVADRVGKLDGDKWAICFQQREVFPKVKTQGRLAEDLRRELDSRIGADPNASIVQAQMQEIERSFNVDNSFPGEKIRELFTRANITFHLLLMKAVSVQGRFDSEDLDVGEVRADYEDTLRRISRATGGLTVFSNKVIDTLKEASAKVDKYYLLVYQPDKGLVSPDNRIEVRVRREKVEVVSLKARTPVKPEGIAIHDFEAGPRTISFRLKNFARAPLEWKEQGRAAVKITVFDEQSAKVFSKEMTVNLVADTVRLSIDFSSPAPGDYFILIEAYDVVSGEKAVFSRAVRLGG